MSRYEELDGWQIRSLENEFIGLTNKTLVKIKRVAERKTRSYYRGGWHSLADREKSLASRVANELHRRDEEFKSNNYDEWGTYTGDPAKDPDRLKVPWWRRKEFWKKVYHL